jgi:hypothetical protein
VSLFFLFVQFEFTHAVGPHAGRYLVQPTASATERAEQLASEAAAEPLDTGRVSELESVIEAAADVLDSWRYQRLE